MTHTMKDLFKIMHQYARNEVKVRNAESAFSAANSATDAYIHNFGYKFSDLESIMVVEQAVLWAIHWSFFKPTRKVPLWSSERRIAFVLEPYWSQKESRSWFEPAKLPA